MRSRLLTSDVVTQFHTTVAYSNISKVKCSSIMRLSTEKKENVICSQSLTNKRIIIDIIGTRDIRVSSSQNNPPWACFARKIAAIHDSRMLQQVQRHLPKGGAQNDSTPLKRVPLYSDIHVLLLILRIWGHLSSQQQRRAYLLHPGVTNRIIRSSSSSCSNHCPMNSFPPASTL